MQQARASIDAIRERRKIIRFYLCHCLLYYYADIPAWHHHQRAVASEPNNLAIVTTADCSLLCSPQRSDEKVGNVITIKFNGILVRVARLLIMH